MTDLEKTELLFKDLGITYTKEIYSHSCITLTLVNSRFYTIFYFDPEEHFTEVCIGEDE